MKKVMLQWRSREEMNKRTKREELECILKTYASLALSLGINRGPSIDDLVEKLRIPREEVEELIKDYRIEEGYIVL